LASVSNVSVFLSSERAERQEENRMTTTTVSPPKKYKPVPFIKGNPIFGNLLEFARDRLSLLKRMADQGDVVGMRFGRIPAILFNRPEDIQSILVEQADDFDKGDLIHHVFRPLIGDSIFSSEGDFHRQQRELMDPSFQPHTISNYVESAGFYGEQLQQTWAEGAIIDIHQQMASLSMSIFGKVLFDADVLSESDELGAAIALLLEYPARAISRFLPIPYNWPVPLHRRTYKAVALIHSDFQRFINERRAKPGERNDLLSLLLQARDESGQPMSNGQLMTECQSLFAAGYETMVTALTWSWYLLCQHPETYTKLQQEVDRVLQGRTPTYADLVRLPSCLQVFKESMRIFPPAFAFFRQALRDVEIDGYLVPKGRLAFIVPYTLHRRPDYFPEPEKFDPERFTPEREKQLPRNAFLPFGTGSRICIGKHFALMEGPLLLATLAQRVTFRLLPGQQIVADPIRHLTLRPNGEVKVTVTRR
jgi:cytochrome P450